LTLSVQKDFGYNRLVSKNH